MNSKTTIAGFITIAALAASAKPAPTLQQRWAEFQKNPKAVMNANPIKKDSKGNIIPAHTIFNPLDIKTSSFIDKKKNYRLGKASGSISAHICNKDGVCLADIKEGRAAARERVEDWLDANEFRAKKIKPTASLEEMEQRGLMDQTLEERPWSDTYWPIAQGILGVRYAAKGYYSFDFDWKKHFNSTIGNKKTTLAAIAQSGKAEDIDGLSPSEKYDLLIGDLKGRGTKVYKNGYLTPSMWKEGEGYFKESGKVEDWMGICHGWAPAAFMEPRPTKAITVKAADGKTDLKFYPADLRGLASFLWAKADTETSFLGGRCDNKDPKTDPDTGRILDEECFDTNPGNWHVAVVNQIGVAKRSFVLDATYDYEVWNQPTYGYKYHYFNPQTGQPAASLKEATVDMASFSKDKFKKFRSSETAAVVGIEMDLTYVVENNPTHAEKASPADDKTETVTYMYDLELNSKGQIIGGEWYTNKHPDFLWMPLAETRPDTPGDQRVTGSWTPDQPLPQFWKDIAVTTATRFGTPITAIVEPLLKAAHE